MIILKNKGLISANTRIRYPQSVKTGVYSIIDDFCYISTVLEIGDYFHIASNCCIIGGQKSSFKGGNFGCISYGVKALCGSDDLVNDISTVLPPHLVDIKNHVIYGNITLDNFVTVGTNTVIMPNVNIPEGVAIGAMSFVPTGFQFEPWTVYAGIKLKKIKVRNKDNIMKQYEEIQKRKRK